MRYPPSFIERLRSHFLMSEVVGRRMALKKHGREFHGLCPFHHEKTPSFTVNDEKGFFHCFGCGAHGDAIEFVRKFERLTYPETIDQLARDSGIPLPQPDKAEARKAEAVKTLYDVLEAAAQWFEKQLDAPGGMSARDYLQQRGLSAETQRLFRTGYAPDQRTALYNHLLKCGFPQKLQAEAGLIVIPDQGAPYDRFRGRVMFPIRNPSGKIIAFGGRLIGSSTNKSIPKYLNSPETPVFRKGEVLYNLDQAKRVAREKNMAVVMEGYMDVVSVAQSGLAYAVATLGTAVTPEHVRLLWQVAKEPVMCLDGDAAGLRAMMRAAEVALPLLKPGYSLRFAMLPKGEDPDSYVQSHGKPSFEKILLSSRRLSQVIWEAVSPNYELNLPEGRAALEENLKQLTDRITHPTVKQHYVSYFRNMLWAKSSALPRTAPLERSPHIERFTLLHHSAILETLVQRLLKTLLKFPQLMHKSQVEETLSRLDIRSRSLDVLRNALLSGLVHTGGDDPKAFDEHLREQLNGDPVAYLPEDTNHLPRENLTSAEEAMALWNETVHTYQIAHLEFELKELQETMGKTLDEASYLRVVELQQTIKKAQSSRTFAPAEADIT